MEAKHKKEETKEHFVDLSEKNYGGGLVYVGNNPDSCRIKTSREIKQMETKIFTMKHKILGDTDPSLLNNQINKWLLEDWKLHGELKIICTNLKEGTQYFYQCMILKGGQNG